MEPYGLTIASRGTLRQQASLAVSAPLKRNVRLSFACMKKVPFELQCADVHEYWNGHYARLMGSTIRLIHHPTGVEVGGEVPQVHNTKGKLRTAEAELRKALMTELTQKVAKHLRLPGR